jgi:hypothetical protein
MKNSTIVAMSRKTVARALAFLALAIVLGSWAYAEEQPPLTGQSAIRSNAGTTGFNTKTYSVIVNSNGSLALGPAGSGSFNFFGLPGVYEVDFPSDISHCVYVGTIGDALADVPAPGLITVTQRFGRPFGIFVQTYDPNGFRTWHPFHLQVQC